jgi:hypothetical protein
MVLGLAYIFPGDNAQINRLIIQFSTTQVVDKTTFSIVDWNHEWDWVEIVPLKAA